MVRVSKVLLLILCFFAFSASQAHAATLYINSSTGNDTTGDGSSGSPYASFHKVYTVASSGDTVDATGTFTWTNAAETGDSGTTGYTLAKNLTIAGHGPDQTIFQASSTDNTADRRVFTVSSTYTVTMSDLALRYGKQTSANGGCVLNSGTLTLTRVEIYNCRATNNNGGGVSTAGVLTMTDSAVYSNTTYYGGGGVYISSNSPDTVTLTNNTIYSNNVTSSGGAFYGGGVYMSGSGSAYLTNNTISANNAGGSYGIGGGLLIYNANLHLYLENNFIASNTASYYAGTSDFHTYGGTIHNNGYNIIGRAESYSFATTGDWTDSNGDGVFVLQTVGTTGRLLRDSAAAVNSNPYGIKTWGVLSGSIAINRATTTANSIVSVPSTDQRGASRSGAPDIGSYEYDGGLVDSTAPTVSMTAPSASATVSGAAVALTASASDDTAVAGVRFYVDGVAQGSEDTTSTYGVSWDSTATTSSTHSAFAVARDSSNNYATSSSVSFTVDNNVAGISDVLVVASTTYATITWNTDEAASSRIYFGLSSSFGTSTAERDTSPRVTSHSMQISGLKQCARYTYKVQSTDASSNTASSTPATFRTIGCTGSAAVSSTGQGSITTAAGGTLSEGTLTLTVPTSFTSTTTEAVFQAHLLDGSTFFSRAGVPSGKSRAGSTVYNLVALTDATTTLSSFETGLTVTLSYTNEDIEGVEESSLKIHRYDSDAWNELSSCTVNTTAKTVTCTTTNFSDFAIFGDAASSSASSGSSHSGSIVQRAETLKRLGNNAAAVALIKEWPVLFGKIEAPTVLAQEFGTSSTSAIFSATLRPGETHPDVKRLQQFLNAKGFVIANTGAGSLGNETEYFGTRTQLALKRYQEANAAAVLVPVGLARGTGLFGPATRAFVNAQLNPSSSS